MREKQLVETEEPIHEFFELSYASYLVLQRSVLQSMPVKWQKKFVELIKNISELIELHPEEGVYQVYLRDDKTGRFVKDLTTCIWLKVVSPPVILPYNNPPVMRCADGN